MTRSKSESAPERVWISPSAFLARSASAVIYDEANRESTDVEYIRVSADTEVSQLVAEVVEAVWQYVDDNEDGEVWVDRAKAKAAVSSLISSVFARSDLNDAAFHRGVDAAKDAIRSEVGTSTNGEARFYAAVFITAIARKCGSDQKRVVDADKDTGHSKIVIPKYKMLETAPKGYYSLGRVHPETVVRWFLDLVHYWFDGSLGDNIFTGMRDDAAQYLTHWIETGELAPDQTTLEIHTRIKFEEWLKSCWTVNPATQATVSPQADNSTTVPDHSPASLPEVSESVPNLVCIKCGHNEPGNILNDPTGEQGIRCTKLLSNDTFCGCKCVFPEASKSIQTTLAEIRTRRAKTTSPPWRYDDQHSAVIECGSGGDEWIVQSWSKQEESFVNERKNGEFIANAPADIDTLLGIIDSLTRSVPKAEIDVEGHAPQSCPMCWHVLCPHCAVNPDTQSRVLKCCKCQYQTDYQRLLCASCLHNVGVGIFGVCRALDCFCKCEFPQG